MELLRPLLVITGLITLFLLASFAMNLGWKPTRSKTCKRLGSLHLAALLLALMAALLSGATFFESSYGTQAALQWIYRTHWFEWLIGGIWVNIFCATILRFPFRISKIGFLLTHLGILTILVGTLITRIWGVEGTMTLLEGKARQSISLEGNAFTLEQKGEDLISESLDELATHSAFPLRRTLGDSDEGVELLEYHPHSILTHRYIPQNEVAGEPNPAIHFEIKSSMFELDRWLVMQNNDLHNPHSLAMGPARFELKWVESADELEKILAPEPEETPESKARLKVSTDNGKTFQIVTLHPHAGQKISVKNTDLEIEVTGIFQNASVTEQGEITEHQHPGFNPALSFSIHHADGTLSKDVRFQKFPSYQGSHQEEDNQLIILLEGFEPGKKGRQAGLEFLVTRDLKFYYRIASSEGVKSGPLILNKLTPLGWNDAVLVVKASHANVTVERVVTPQVTKAGQKSVLPYLKLLPFSKDKQFQPINLLYGETQELHLADSTVMISLGERKLKIPFEIKLKDFRKVDYPNTTRAMSYESDVVVTNLDGLFEGVKSMETTISMNNVLDHRGWRFFQASFQINGTREYSTFQVAQNPGIESIYLGSIVMVLGIGVMFWLTPFIKRMQA
jgi:hypothetical protein